MKHTMKTIFAKYNSERLPQYQIVTKIVVDESGKKYALKEPLCDEAKEHIDNIFNHYGLLKSAYDINLVKPTKIENGVLFEMADGISLEHILLDAIAQNDSEKFERYIAKFLEFVDGMVSARDVIFEPSKEFETVFGAWEIDEPQDIIKIANIDLIFGNIFVDAEDNFTLIDYEWVFDFEVPKSYVVWRSLAIFSAYHSISIEKFADLYFYFKNNDYLLRLNDKFDIFVQGEDKKYFLAPKARKVAHFFNVEKVETIGSEYFIQLFIEDENGISEANSLKLHVSQNSEVQTFEFDLSNHQNIKNLRLDPLNECCVVEIESLHLRRKNGTIDLLPYVYSNADIHYGTSYFFTTEDPIIYFEGLHGESFKEAQKLIVTIRFAHMGKDALQVILKQTKTELDQTKTELDQTKTELDQTKTELDQTKTELDQTKTELIGIYMSKSWKITRPLRAIVRRLKVSNKKNDGQ